MNEPMSFADLIKYQQALIDVLKEYIITHLATDPKQAVETLRELEVQAAERVK